MQQNTSILFLSDFSDDLFILDETSIFYLLPLIRAPLCKTGFGKLAVVHCVIMIEQKTVYRHQAKPMSARPFLLQAQKIKVSLERTTISQSAALW